MGDERDPSSIQRQLDTVIRLMGYRIVEKMTLTEGAPILRRLGLSSSEIATIYESTPNAVNARLAESKKRKAGARRGKS